MGDMAAAFEDVVEVRPALDELSGNDRAMDAHGAIPIAQIDIGAAVQGPGGRAGLPEVAAIHVVREQGARRRFDRARLPD